MTKKSNVWNLVLASLVIGAMCSSCCSGDASECADEVYKSLKADGYTHMEKPSWNSAGRFYMVSAVDPESKYPVRMNINVDCNCNETLRTFLP